LSIFEQNIFSISLNCMLRPFLAIFEKFKYLTTATLTPKRNTVMWDFYGLCQRWWNTGPLFRLYKSALPLYFTISGGEKILIVSARIFQALYDFVCSWCELFCTSNFFRLYEKSPPRPPGSDPNTNRDGLIANFIKWIVRENFFYLMWVVFS